MTPIPIPQLLNRMASADADGVDLGADQKNAQELEICRAWGYPIEVNGPRVSLKRDRDSLIPAWIEAETEPLAWRRSTVRGFLEIGSTNEEALFCAREGFPEGTVICAEHQSAGKGRLGRTWFSPPRAGLYFTVLLRPRRSLDQWPILTFAAAIALCDALRDLNDDKLVSRTLDLDLKWPNDVMLSGKKAAGILLETCHTTVSPYAAVVGVGVNIAPESIPPDHSGSATAVDLEAGVHVPRRWLLVRFLRHFQHGYCSFSDGRDAEIIGQWKERSRIWNNVPITVRESDHVRTAVTCGLTETGALRIRTEKGREESLVAGDVTIRRR